ncbi:MAG: hypothetical protein ACLPXZ_05850 [Mycobacterium sp.]
MASAFEGAHTTTGKSFEAGYISGIFNTAIPDRSLTHTSGELSGLANMGTVIAGLFNLSPLAHISA